MKKFSSLLPIVLFTLAISSTGVYAKDTQTGTTRTTPRTETITKSYEKRDAIITRQAEVRDKIEERKITQTQRQDERKITQTEKREVRKEEIVQRMVKRGQMLTERWKKRLQRLDDIFTRIKARIDKFKAAGKDTSSLDGLVATAKSKHDAAAAAIDKAGTTISSLTGTDKPQDATKTFVDSAQAVERALKDYHASLVEIIRSMKGMSEGTKTNE